MLKRENFVGGFQASGCCVVSFHTNRSMKTMSLQRTFFLFDLFCNGTKGGERSQGTGNRRRRRRRRRILRLLDHCLLLLHEMSQIGLMECVTSRATPLTNKSNIVDIHTHTHRQNKKINQND